MTNEKKLTHKVKKQLGLASLISLAFIAITCLFHFNIGDFYQLSVDPEYLILYNSVLVGKGTLAINFIDHPATPLIYISGIAVWVFYLFTGELSYIQDFIQNPEQYLHAASIFNCILIALVSLYASKKVFQYTSSFLLAIVLQLTLFTNSSLLEISSRLIPESTMLIPVFLMCALALKYIYSKSEKLNKNRLIWQFSALVAFGVACKLSFAPMILFPLILLGNNLKSILTIIGRTVLLTCVFAYPLITNISESFEWISDMFLHSGKHGTGDSNVISFQSIPDNLITILFRDVWFWLLFVLQIITTILVKLRTNQTDKTEKQIRVNIAFISAIILVLILTLKHFSIHYFMPFYGFKMLMLILLWFNLKELNLKGLSNKKLKPSLAFGIALTLILIPEVHGAKNHFKYIKSKREKAVKKQEHIKSLIHEENSSLIIDAPYWGTPFHEYAHIYGFMHTYKRKTAFKKELREKYSNFYCYVTWSDSFNHWDKFVDFNTVFEKNSIVYIYIGPSMKGLETIQERLDKSGIEYRSKTLYNDEETGEELIKIESQISLP